MPTPSQPSRALLIDNIGQLVTLHTGWDDSQGPRHGPAMRDLGVIPDAAVLCVDGKIAAFGARAEVRQQLPALYDEHDAMECVVLPGLVDSHTHPVFCGPRLLDFEERLAGSSYQQIAERGGGIRSSSLAVRKASIDELADAVRAFALEAWQNGSTTLEMKSGYGLDLESELKSLRAIRQVAQELKRLTIVPTLLGAHVVPPEFAHDRAIYVQLVCEEMIPAAARERLADFVDVFCEHEAFTPVETEAILQAAQRNALGTRLHIGQFSSQDLARFLRYGVASMDHLECVTEQGVRQLAESKTVATLLPGATYFLARQPYPPARRLIDAGVAVAIATDYNPGTSPTASMPLMMSMACTQMRMTPAEAITAATINAAHALRLAHCKGSMGIGKDADLVPFIYCKDYREVPYWFGHQRPALMVTQGSIFLRA